MDFVYKIFRKWFKDKFTYISKRKCGYCSYFSVCYKLNYFLCFSGKEEKYIQQSTSTISNFRKDYINLLTKNF